VPLSSNPLLYISGVFSICSFPKKPGPYDTVTDQNENLERDAVHHSLPGDTTCIKRMEKDLWVFFVAMKMFVFLVLRH
jgi:hypothetical protein